MDLNLELNVEENQKTLTLTISAEDGEGAVSPFDFILEVEQIAHELLRLTEVQTELLERSESLPEGALALVMKAQARLSQCKSDLGAAKLVATGQMPAAAFGFPEFD